VLGAAFSAGAFLLGALCANAAPEPRVKAATAVAIRKVFFLIIYLRCALFAVSSPAQIPSREAKARLQVRDSRFVILSHQFAVRVQFRFCRSRL
jgi:hypothetical protein